MKKKPKFRSKFEETVYVTAEVSLAYEPEKWSFNLPVTYTPDFHIKGTNIYVETKGDPSRWDRKKFLQAIKSHPEKDLRIVFQRDVPITKTMTCSDWAKKYNITYAIGNIPTEWKMPKIDDNDIASVQVSNTDEAKAALERFAVKWFNKGVASAEVTSVQEAEDDAYDRGFDEGYTEGREEALSEKEREVDTAYEEGKCDGLSELDDKVTKAWDEGYAQAKVEIKIEKGFIPDGN